MRILQINLNHCEAAQDLLSQTVRENSIDVAIICEQYRNLHGNVWVADSVNKCAIWACGDKAIEGVQTYMEAGFVRAKIGGIYIYSCYAPPNDTVHDYKHMLGRLARDAEQHSPKVIAGDFNAWAVEWGSRKTNERGRILLESLSSNDLVLANNGGVNTFRARGKGSIVDLTFLSSSLIRNLKWRVSEHYTHSDHQSIICSINDGRGKSPRGNAAKFIGWATGKLDTEAFLETFLDQESVAGNVMQKVHTITSSLTRACDASMPRRRMQKSRPPNYWWTEEIGRLRSSCLKARRRSQRGRFRPDFETRQVEYQIARKALQLAINRSKRLCFRQICNEAENNPWGTAYRVVMARLKGTRAPELSCPLLLRQIVSTLFPRHLQHRGPEARERRSYSITRVAAEEIIDIVRNVGDTKAPGPDFIPNQALKLAILNATDLFAEIFNQCLEEGIFPDSWKTQRLVLLPKPNKRLGDPSSYRPICLLDTMGKILEKVIYNRLLPAVEERHGLSDRQFGFRRARSTVDAIRRVTSIIRAAIEGKGAERKYCALVTLDVKNAFNSARWDRIMIKLEELGVPYYLVNIISNYFSDRKLLYNTEEGQETYTVTAGVPQGSILGPLLWNIMYNDVLTLEFSPESTIVGFADDIALVVMARHLKEVELYANEAVNKISSWLDAAGLQLAEHKTEAVLICNRRRHQTVVIRVGQHEITSKRQIKYLGVMIDDRMNFGAHINYIADKASKVTAALSRMMPNVGGPKQSKRQVIARVVSSTILYAAPVWSGSLEVQRTKKKLASVYRLAAMRVCSSYRTISEDAVNVIAGMVPIDILADEARRRYERARSDNMERETRNDEKEESMRRWQDRWDESQKGRWTYKLIPNISIWIGRRHGEVNYYLTQFLSGHGGYRSYLFKYGHDDSPVCPRCPDVIEDVEHALFNCPRFANDKALLEREVGRDIHPHNIINTMIESQDNWKRICSYVKVVQIKLREEEQRRKNSGNMNEVTN